MCASQDPIATLWVGDDLRCQLISNRYIYIYIYMSYIYIYVLLTVYIHRYIYIYMHKSVGNQRMRHVDMYPLVGFCMFLIVFVSSQSSTKSGVEAHGQIFRSTFRSSSKLITYRTYQNCVDFRQQTSCQHIYVNICQPCCLACWHFRMETPHLSSGERPWRGEEKRTRKKKTRRVFSPIFRLVKFAVFPIVFNISIIFVLWIGLNALLNSKWM